MKLRASHLFYIFVVILVGSVYYFDYYKGEQKEKAKAESSVFIPFAKDQIAKIEIKRNNNEEILLEQENKIWKIKKPLSDLADENVMSDWLTSLTNEKSLDQLGEGESVQWVNYGLEPSKANITITSQAGDNIELHIGTRKNFEGNTFLRKNKGSMVLVGASSWTGHFEKTLRDLRDKRIFRSSTSQVESFIVKKGKEQLVLKNKEGLWFSPVQEKWALGQNLVRELVNILNDTRASEFVLESDPDSKQKITYGFNLPSCILEVHLKDQKDIWTADIAQGKDGNWYIWLKDLKRVYKIEQAGVDKLTKSYLDGLRDRESAFAFNKEEVKKIVVEAGVNFELTKMGEEWKSSQEKQIVDQNQVSALLDQLHQLKVADFFDGKKTGPGLEVGKKKFILLDDKGQTLWSLILGESFKKKVEQGTKQYFYAKTSFNENIFSVEDLSIMNLPLDKVFKKEEVPTPPKADNK